MPQLQAASLSAWTLAIVLGLALKAGISPVQAQSASHNLTFPQAQVLIGEEARQVLGAQANEQSWHVDFANLPEDVLREALAARSTSMACTDAANALLLLEELSDFEPPSRSTRYYVVRNYVDHCLLTLDDVSNPHGAYNGAEPEDARTLLRLIGEDGVARLRRSLLITRGTPCSGTLVWITLDGVETLAIATAAHCVGSLRVLDGEPSVSIGTIRDFVDHAGTRYQLDFANGGRTVSFDPLQDDFALITLGADFDAAQIGMPISANSISEAWTPLYIIGQNLYLKEQLLGAQLREDNVQGVQPNDVTTIGFDVFCRAFGQSQAVLFHNCQTVGGTSGAAVFIIGQNGFELVGVHAGNRSAFERASIDIVGLLNILSESRALNYATLFGRLAD